MARIMKNVIVTTTQRMGIVQRRRRSTKAVMPRACPIHDHQYHYISWILPSAFLMLAVGETERPRQAGMLIQRAS
jgi:hypothetical protein